MFDPMESPFCLTQPAKLPGPPNWTRHIPFAFALIDALRPATIVELGVHRGTSYLSFCQAVAELKIPARCFGIDTWQGDQHAGSYESHVQEELRAYHDPLYGEFSRLLQCEFDAAQAQFADREVDLLHIDGLHTYDAVRHDFEHWLPKLSKQGVVLLHDIRVRERGFGVWQFWEEIRGEYDHFSLDHLHGLGVLIVGSQAPAKFRALELAARESAGFDAFFDALGQRAELTAERGELQREIAARDDRLKEHAQRAERLWTELTQQRARFAERAAELETARQKSTASLNRAARQIEQLELHVEELMLAVEERNATVSALESRIDRMEFYYGHLRFRLAEKLNRGLRKFRWAHDATKASLLSLGKLTRSAREVRA